MSQLPTAVAPSDRALSKYMIVDGRKVRVYEVTTSAHARRRTVVFVHVVTAPNFVPPWHDTCFGPGGDRLVAPMPVAAHVHAPDEGVSLPNRVQARGATLALRF